MNERGLVPQSCWKCSAVTSNVFFTPSRIATEGTTTMYFDHPYRLYSSMIVWGYPQIVDTSRLRGFVLG